jgi:hypothetical protein|tara:strand:+ start:345 stop:749 length:405 start_codon:yes stop_codon:yes gene_type:complete
VFKQPTLDIFDNNEEALIESTYTKKVSVPVYVPQYQKPSVYELFDHMKSMQMIKRINESKVSAEDKKFLIYAAQRHIIFNFAKIADYYAHSSAEVQDLMEQSALVIVDFDKAIENGFATLNNELSNQYLNEQND